jgi:hypothetical protein
MEGIAMTRPKTAIPNEEITTAISYIKRRLRTRKIELVGDPSLATVEKELNSIVTARNKQERVATFDRWCLDYLTDADRSKLRTSLRKHRQRLHKRGNAAQVSMTVKAFDLLKKVASRENLNYSQVLEKYLWNAAKPTRRKIT